MSEKLSLFQAYSQGNQYLYSYDSSVDLTSVTYPNTTQPSTYTYVNHYYTGGTDFRSNPLPETTYYSCPPGSDSSCQPLSGRLQSEGPSPENCHPVGRCRIDRFHFGSGCAPASGGKCSERLTRLIRFFLSCSQTSRGFDPILQILIGGKEKPTSREVGAVSTGRCNTGLEFTRWSFEVQSFSWALIEAQGYFVEVGLRVA